MAAIEPWHIKGEFILSCNCTVFCPCVISLGKHPPTEGVCKTWGGVRIDDGSYGDVSLSGLNLGVIIEIPGQMSRGDWTAGLFIDESADVYQVKALTKIMTGRARGSTHLLSILVSRFLGVHQEPIVYEPTATRGASSSRRLSTAKSRRSPATSPAPIRSSTTANTGWPRRSLSHKP